MCDSVSRRWRELRDQVSRDTIERKDSQAALRELIREYDALGDIERRAVDRVLIDWLGSDDETLRFDAMAIISASRVHSTVPALRALELRLLESDAPSAPYEVAKVGRLLAELSQ